MICTVHIQACSKPLPSLPRLFQLRRVTRILTLPSESWMQHSSQHRRRSGISSASICFNKSFRMTNRCPDCLEPAHGSSKCERADAEQKIPNIDNSPQQKRPMHCRLNTRDRKCTSLAARRRNHHIRTGGAEQMAGQMGRAWPCTASGSFGRQSWE